MYLPTLNINKLYKSMFSKFFDKEESRYKTNSNLKYDKIIKNSNSPTLNKQLKGNLANDNKNILYNKVVEEKIKSHTKLSPKIKSYKIPNTHRKNKKNNKYLIKNSIFSNSRSIHKKEKHENSKKKNKKNSSRSGKILNQYKEKLQTKKKNKTKEALKMLAKYFFENVKKNKIKTLKNFIKGFYKRKKEEIKDFDFSILDEDGSGVEHYSCWHKNIEIIYFLLNQNVNFNRKNRDGITPLMMAALKGNFEIVEILISVTNINSQDKEGNTALHYSVVKGHLNVIKALLSKNELITNICNKNNQKALELADPSIYLKIQEYFSVHESHKKIFFQKFEINENMNYKDFLENEKKFYEKSLENFVRSTNIDSSKTIKTQKINISNFYIHSKIGQGSFGEVFLVQKNGKNTFYAMKVLEKSKIFKKNLKKYAITERNVLSVIDHPFIAKLRYAFQNTDYLFLVMDYYPGGDLHENLQKKGKFKEKIAKIYISEILLSIEDLHQRNVIFRDLKPENIVLDSEGHIRLIDFGLSKEGVNTSLKGGKSFCGSLAYLAPEMIKKEGHGKVMDWYSLGIVIYEMLIGTPPFYANSKEKLFYNIQYENLDFPDFISDEAKDLISRLLVKDPCKRLGSEFGAIEIKSHPWFYGLNWEDVVNRKLNPPRPSIKKFKVNDIKTPLKFQKDEKELITSITGWTFIEETAFEVE